MRGRPTLFRKELIRQVEALAGEGYTRPKIASFLGVSLNSLGRWGKRHKEFGEALKRGVDKADNEVEVSLYKRATGYNHPEVKVFCNDGKITTYEVIRYYPPDATSMIFWLKNRQPEKWKDEKIKVEQHTHLTFIKDALTKAKGIDETGRLKSARRSVDG